MKYILIVILFCGGAAIASPSEARHPLLTIAIDGRSSALGKAMSAHPGNTASIIYNPAGLSFVTKNIVSFGQSNSSDIYNQYSGGIIYQETALPLGFSYLTLNIPNITETSPSLDASGEIVTNGEFSYSSSMYAIASSFKLLPQLSVGINLKAFKSNIAISSEQKNTFAVDSAIYYQPFTKLAFGYVLENSFSHIPNNDQSQRYPRFHHFGIYGRSKTIFLTTEYEVSEYQEHTFRIGGGYLLTKQLELLAGNDNGRVSLVSSFNTPKGVIDYAYLAKGTQYTQSENRVTMGLKW